MTTSGGDARHLRKVLEEAFDDEELNRFCHDHCAEVFNRFALGMTRTQKVFELVGYFDRRRELPTLHGLLRHERPKWFQEEGAPPPPRTTGSPPVPAVAPPPTGREPVPRF
ncbi:MAG: hypothetical protein HC884_16355, partial [Chloroflexaceae bacterium]|nr:hypothetical protein [Chloroflexaceae bacterium]